MELKADFEAWGRQVLPAPTRRWLRGMFGQNAPAPGHVNFGSLRRVNPISRVFGYDRGQPVDRYYIEGFLRCNAIDIQGQVLEIADNTYTRRFGGTRVVTSDVLHAVPGNPNATLVGDLSRSGDLPADRYDCIILTQTLLCIYDIHAAVRTLHRILKPGGVALVTLPGICQIAQPDMRLWGDYWRFTSLSAQRLFEEAFIPAGIEVATHGNVLVATAFLYGLSTEELQRTELDHCDPDYQVSITVRAVKEAGTPVERTFK